MLSKKIMNSFLLLVVAFSLYGCSRAMLEDELGLDGKLILSVKVTPSKATIEVGDSVQLSAVVTYSDDTTLDVTSATTWTAVLPSVATMSPGQEPGLVMGVSRGTGVVNAFYRGVSANALITVTSANLSAIEVTPLNETISVGVGQNYIATGIYSDSTKSDITQQVTWSSSDNTIAVISNDVAWKGHATGVSPGSVTVSATLGSTVGSTGLTVTNAALVSLGITPAMTSIMKDATQQYIATAHYANGSVVDVTNLVSWSSSNTSVASISNIPGKIGMATALAVGQSTIMAALNGTTATATLIVNGATLDSLAITPHNSTGIIGFQEKFKLTGTYSDGSTRDLTEQAAWSSSDILTLLVSNIPTLKGHSLGLLSGPVTVAASVFGMTVTTPFTVTPALLVSIQVNPSAITLPLGLSQPLEAIGTYSDGTVKDLTDTVVWSMDTPSIATVSNAVGTAGNIISNTVGVANAVATYGAVTGAAAVTTTAATLTSIALNPPSSVALGLVKTLTAIGTYSDGSTADITHLANWSSNNPSVLNPSNASGFKGMVYSLGLGSANIFATLDGVSQSTMTTVTPPELASISITSTGGSLLGIGLRQFKALGLYTDGSTADLTNSVNWSVSSGIASINLNGLLLAISPGQTNVTATLNSITKTIPIIIGL